MLELQSFSEQQISFPFAPRYCCSNRENKWRGRVEERPWLKLAFIHLPFEMISQISPLMTEHCFGSERNAAKEREPFSFSVMSRFQRKRPLNRSSPRPLKLLHYVPMSNDLCTALSSEHELSNRENDKEEIGQVCVFPHPFYAWHAHTSP